MQRKESWCACPYCIRKPGENPDMKVKHLWARGLSSSQERGDLSKTLAHQPTQNGNADEKWSSQEWKSDEVLEARVGRLVNEQCEWQWYGLWHRRRIRHVVIIQIILAQGEWTSDKDVGPIFKRCNERQQQTFFNMGNVYVFDTTRIFSCEKITQNIYAPSPTQGTVSQWSRCLTCRTIRWDLWSDSN